MSYQQSEKMAERKQARRRRFLDAAIALFARLGYHAATVPMIVREAESSTGAFYLYFRNKEDVYVAALQEIGARLSGALNHGIASESRPEARMAAAVRCFVAWLAENAPEAHILMEAAALGGRMEEARRAIIESHVRSVAVARCWVGSVLEAAQGWIALPSTERRDSAALAAVVADFNLRGAGLKDPGTTRWRGN